MNAEQALLKVFGTNFVAYYRSHAAHVNVVGRHFLSDHELLGKIYEDLQAEIDTLAELLRTLDAEMPATITDTQDLSEIVDTVIEDQGDGLGYLQEVLADLETLIAVHLDLEQATQDDLDYNHLANYAQDRVKTLHKYKWMLTSTLKKR